LNRGHASQGEKDFAGGNYLGAAEWYDQALKKNPDDPRLHYNAGTTAYKNNLYDEAIASFQQALKSDDLGLQEQTYYNLGNAFYQKGEELAQSNPGQAEKLWQQARDAYTGSLNLNPAASDSKDNRELVSRRLEELKKQQEQQKKQNEQQKKKQEQKQDQAGEQQGNQDNQSPQDQQKKQDNQDGQQGKESPSPEPDQSSGAEKSPENNAKETKEQGAGAPDKEEPQAQEAQSGQGAKADNQDQARKNSATSTAARPGQSGKMTEEEARQLLSGLKEEEGRLNFVPQTGKGKAEKEGTWKDW
jgi:Ca-activated chloride channel family protein